MTKKKKPKDPTVEYSDEVKDRMAEDPAFAEAIRSFAATARQAMEGVDSGKYKSFDDAMEKITGNKPKPVDPEDLPQEAQDALYAEMSEHDVVASTDEVRTLYTDIATAIGNDHHLFIVGCALAAIIAGWIDMFETENPGKIGRDRFIKMVDKFASKFKTLS